MANIGIVHPDLMSKGGAENVCMHFLEALQEDHTLTLYSNSDPDFDTLNEYYDTTVVSDAIEVVIPSSVGKIISSITSSRLTVMKRAWLNRGVKSSTGDLDLVISTKNEFDFDIDNIQYIHYPIMDRAGPDEAKPDSKLHDVYDMISFSIAGFDRSNSLDHSSLFLTNSSWTAQVFQDAYGVEPQVLYPPVKTDGIDGSHWPDRENGFVSVGRIEESKNIGRSIEIVRALNERGYEVHLHIIGSANDGEYSRRIKGTSNKYEYVKFEGEVSRSRLEELLSSHKFGLHAKDHEHFGIAVAEMVSAGMIPFVPNSGGQVELVNSQEAVLYEDKSEAVEKISSVINDSHLQQEIRKNLPNIEEDFGSNRFRNEIQSIVNMALRTKN